MLKVVQVEYIRFLYHQQHKSIRAIAKELGCARQTVRKALLIEDVRDYGYHLTKPKPQPVLAPYADLIRAWLKEDKAKPPKQRHSARRIYQRLKEEYGFRGSERTVRRAVQQLKKADKEPATYIPLEFALGEAAQCDWGEAQVYLGGELVTVHLFCMRLCASRVSFVRAYLREKQEAFFEAHRLAFEFFGGVPKKVIYDNLKTAVRKILVGTNREEQEGFSALKAHYVFTAEFCNPREAHEKGQVENLVGYVRRNFLVPIPQCASLEELNQWLLAKCLEYASKHLVPGTQKRVAEVWGEEKQALLPLPPKGFACYRLAFAQADSQQRVRFETNWYSVPRRYAYEQLTVKAYVDKVELWFGKELVASHQRLYGKNQESLDPRHYLEGLLQKPRAMANAKPLKHPACPLTYAALLEELLPQGREGLREFRNILQLEPLFGREVLLAAVSQAVEQNRPKTLSEIRELARALAQGPLAGPEAGISDRLSNLIQDTGLHHFDALAKGA